MTPYLDEIDELIHTDAEVRNWYEAWLRASQNLKAYDRKATLRVAPWAVQEILNKARKRKGEKANLQ